MLTSTKIQRRQSEIRQELASLAGAETLTDEQRSKLDALDTEYQDGERRYRAALIAEDDERREAGRDLETREAGEWQSLVDRYEVRAALLHLDEGRTLDGPTAEIVQEMRSGGGYKGIPIPFEALLEQRSGETIASGTPDPIRTAPIIDRLFANSAASRMGVRTVNIPFGESEYPIVSSSVAAGWATTETGGVSGPTAFSTADKSLSPDSTLGITMTLTRKAMKQTGPGLEQAVRRDMAEAIRVKLDAAVFLGSGSSGEPTGIITGATAAGVTTTGVDAAVTWGAFRSAVTRFMTGNAANAPSDCRLLIRPEIWDALDGTVYDTGSGLTEWDRLVKNIPAGNIVMTTNGLAAPTGSPTASTAILTTLAGGVAPALLGIWGGVDVIRDPFSAAQSGQLKITGLVTADVAILRAAQIEILTGLQD